MSRPSELIRRIKGGLDDPAMPLSGIMQGCLTLARIEREPEWQLYFHLQLLGVSLSEHSQTHPPLWEGNPKTLKWQPAIRFAQDRETADKKVHSSSVEEIENFIREAEDALATEDDDFLKALKRHDPIYHLESLGNKNQLRGLIRESRGFLAVAKTRAREFVASVESKAVAEVSKAPSLASCVFIGHGRSPAWKDLALFLRERLGLEYDEFNREPAAGKSTVARLQEMLDRASFAFLVLTGEDEKAGGSLHARENVIHEAGLFQGRLGFNRAIILLEEGCEEFSNIHGLGQIRFPRGNIKPEFEAVRMVLEREGLLGGTDTKPRSDGAG